LIEKGEEMIEKWREKFAFVTFEGGIYLSRFVRCGGEKRGNHLIC
jgi:hypothetical protein